MKIILIIIGAIFLVLGFLGLGVIRNRSIKWSKMPQWHIIVEMVLGIVIIVIGFMSLYIKVFSNLSLIYYFHKVNHF